jgi:hypothetical protein
MNILMITKFAPLPANSGGKQRSLAVLRRLSEIGSVSLCAFREEGSDLRGLERMGVTVATVPWRPGPLAIARGLLHSGSISAARWWDPALARVLQRAAGGGVDHLQVEYTQLAPYSKGVRARQRALDMHNVESALAASFASGRGPLASIPYRVEAAALRRLERRVAGTFDFVTVVSEADKRRLAGVASPVVAPNGWNSRPEPLPAAAEPVAAFIALMGWPPNDDAARWLARDIWPRVRRELPDARLRLVGRDPSVEVRALHGTSGIEVTGTVDDVDPYLASARVALAPLRAGGGSRLKILEALDAGRPVVATSKGAEGLEDLAGDGLTVHDDPAAFAATVVRLLRDPEEARRLGIAGHAAVAARHSWTTALEPLASAVEADAGPARGGRR